MSIDDSYDSADFYTDLTGQLRNLNGVHNVDGPKIESSESGHVYYVIYLTEEYRSNEARRSELTKTVVPPLMEPKPVDWWWGEQQNVSPLTLYTGGLNPTPEDNEGRHTL
jgi:hypothetical protein